MKKKILSILAAAALFIGTLPALPSLAASGNEKRQTFGEFTVAANPANSVPVSTDNALTQNNAD